MSLMSLDLISRSSEDPAEQFELSICFKIKAPAFCLGLRVRVPRVLWNWTLLNTPGDSSELAHRFPGWQTHKAKGKGEVFVSSLGPTIPLKSLWLAPSRIIQKATGNPQAMFSSDKHPGQREDLNMPSWGRNLLKFRRRPEDKGATQPWVCYFE